MACHRSRMVWACCESRPGGLPPDNGARLWGGWSEFQFAERRMPTLDELNKAAPDTPVFVLHLYDRALLNRAALRALAYDSRAPPPARGGNDVDGGGEPP